MSQRADPGHEGKSSMLTHEELKEICQKNGLTRGEVFQIRTQYASMCLMSEQWVQEQKNPSSTNPLDIKLNKRGNRGDQAKDKSSVDGISVEYFSKHCNFLAGSLPHINKRILVAQGKLKT